MTPEQVDKLINLVVTVGGKAATEGFAIAMRRVTYLAVVDLVFAVFFTVMCCVSLYCAQVCWRKHLEHKADSYYDGAWLVGCWATRVVTGFLWMIIVLPALSNGFDMLMNPEWHAVQMLLGLL